MLCWVAAGSHTAENIVTQFEITVPINDFSALLDECSSMIVVFEW